MRRNLFGEDNDYGVDVIRTQSLDSLKHLDETRTRLANAKAAKRKAENDLFDHEINLTAEYRAENPSMSQTQFDKQVKVYVGQNEAWRKLRDEVTHLEAQVESADADRSVLSRDIEIAAASLNALGGQLYRSGMEVLAKVGRP